MALAIFQYSIGDAKKIELIAAEFEDTAFNTPLEMRNYSETGGALGYFLITFNTPLEMLSNV